MKRIVMMLLGLILLCCCACSNSDGFIGVKTLTDKEKETVAMFESDYESYMLYEYRTRCGGTLEISVERYSFGELLDEQGVVGSLGLNEDGQGIGMLLIRVTDEEVQIVDKFSCRSSSSKAQIEMPFELPDEKEALTTLGYLESDLSIIKGQEILLLERIHAGEDGVIEWKPNSDLTQYPYYLAVKCVFNDE